MSASGVNELTPTTVPALTLCQTPRLVRRLARALGALFLALPGLLLFVPWQQSVRGDGRVVAYAPLERQQVVEAPIDGRVIACHVQEGSVVAAGDLLMELADNDPRLLDRLREQRAASEAKLEAAEAKLGAYGAQVLALEEAQRTALRAAEERVSMARDRVLAADKAREAAEANELTARLNLERQRQLLPEGLTSQRSVELAELASAQAHTEVERARAAARAARSEEAALVAERERTEAEAAARLGSARAARDEARGDVAASRESLLGLEVRLARQETQLVTAPMAGTVFRVAAFRGGEMVKAGEDLVVIVPTTGALAVELWVDGNDMPLLAEDRPVRLQLEGWPAVQFVGWPSVAVGTFGGRVKLIDATDDGRGRFRVLVLPDPSEPSWPSGRYLRQGVRAKGWVLLEQVSLGYELWRQLNGFPPVVAPDEPGHKPAQGGK